MAVDELEDQAVADQTEGEQDAGEDEAPQKMDLEVQIKAPSACERHVTVTVPRPDIERYYENAVGEMLPKAMVPGFRPGHAPRKLVEKRFRKDVLEQIKSSLLMDSMSQVSEDYDLTAISEPDFDITAVEVPDEGPMTYEFDLEVRPEFDLPDWKGLKVQRAVKEFTDTEVDDRLRDMLSRHGTLTPIDEPAAKGDFVTLHVTCRHEGEVVSEETELQARVRPVLSFHDGKLENFGELMEGTRAGDVREGRVPVSENAANEALQGKTVDVALEVLDVKRLVMPELTPKFLADMGDFQSEADLREAVLADLNRRHEYEQWSEIRKQVTSALVEAADWELPPGLLQRQSARELERAVLELRRSGYGEEEIRAHENELRQNSRESTAAALKQHFILEKLAEEYQIEATDEDYEQEVRLIAAQSDESPRRVRARLEKGDLMDAVRNQIVERKAIDLVLEHAQFEDVPVEPKKKPEMVAPIAMAAAGTPNTSIPEAVEAPKKKQTAEDAGSSVAAEESEQEASS